MEFDGFDWDNGNYEKCQKHGVSVSEIEQLFERRPLVGPDLSHSVGEQRFRAVGVTTNGRQVFVVFTWRSRDGSTLLRPVSARYMHEKEMKAHAEDISRIQE